MRRLRSQLSLLEENRHDALFSPCRQYRYMLRRQWGEGTRTINWLMLNPSTADEFRNDPTVAKCERLSRRWGYDGLVVTNLFALRATDPADMKRHTSPVGENNDEAIRIYGGNSELVVCAWGNHGDHLGRWRHVVALLGDRDLHALTINAATGQPAHPLYLSESLQPTVWRKASPTTAEVRYPEAHGGEETP